MIDPMLALLLSIALGSPVAIAVAIRAAARADEARIRALHAVLAPVVDAEPIPELVSVDEALALVAGSNRTTAR